MPCTTSCGDEDCKAFVVAETLAQPLPPPCAEALFSKSPSARNNQHLPLEKEITRKTSQ